MNTPLTKPRFIGTVLCLLAAATASLAVLVNIGSQPATLFGPMDPTSQTIIFSTRLPRLLLGMITGAALAGGGSAFQALLKNPLADPYILGVSGGAALGSVVGVALGLPSFGIMATAFLAALISMLLIYWIAQTRGRLEGHTLLLVGVVFNAFAFSIVMLINVFVTMEEAHEILMLLIGGITLQSYPTLLMLGGIVAFCVVMLSRYSAAMNAVSMGDDHAHYLGVGVNRLRHVIFFATSLMIGAVVSVCGLIGFVGLFIPHITRMFTGSDHRLLIPASALIGGIFLMWSDTLARVLLVHTTYATELPVGVITAVLGGPFFVWALKKEMI